MAQKKTVKKTKKQEYGETPAYIQLKADLKEGTPRRAYLFHGPESYLREEALRKLKELLVSPGFEEFNYHPMDGGSVTPQILADVLDGLPMMAERTLTVVTDLDLFRQNAGSREKFAGLLADLPEYCCLVFVYDTVEYKPDREMKELYGALKKYVETVEFLPSESGALVHWVRERFAEQGKDIDRSTAEYLIFLCGSFMANLSQEIRKIGAYARGNSVTQADIDAVAIPVLSAQVFQLTDAVLQRENDRAAGILGDLLKMQTDPNQIVGALGWQLRRIYTARMAIEGGKGQAWLMDLWHLSSDFQARKWISAARRASMEWCASALKQCQTLDRRLKSERGRDREGELKLLLAHLEALP